ncbi:MAG: type II toxin-antitoxin system VapC family toxin [Candidatus Latescibacterota bacterium]
MGAPVLDAHALLVYLEREAGFATVRDLFCRALTEQAPLPVTTVNVGEVLYIVRRERGEQKAAETERILLTLPIELVDVDLALTREAARLKAGKQMSFADCFAAALARQREAAVVTGDPEFHQVEDEIAVIWLGSQERDPAEPQCS